MPVARKPPAEKPPTKLRHVRSKNRKLLNREIEAVLMHGPPPPEELPYGLTEAQLQAMKPREVFRLVALVSVRAKDLHLALRAAAEWAPYEHPKLTNSTVEATISVIDKLSPPDQRRLRDALITIEGSPAGADSGAGQADSDSSLEREAVRPVSGNGAAKTGAIHEALGVLRGWTDA